MARMRLPVAPSNLAFQGSVQVKGLREYSQKLQSLGDGMLETGCVRALALGGEVLVRAVRRFVPVLKMPDPRREPGTLRNAVQKMRVRGRAAKYAVTYVIGIRLLTSRQVSQFKRQTGRKSSENPRDPFYGTILVYGRTPRTRHDFMRPGFQAGAPEAVRVSGQELQRYTLGEIRRLGAQ